MAFPSSAEGAVSSGDYMGPGSQANAGVALTLACFVAAKLASTSDFVTPTVLQNLAVNIPAILRRRPDEHAERALQSLESGMSAWAKTRASKPTLWNMRAMVLQCRSLGGGGRPVRGDATQI